MSTKITIYYERKTTNSNTEYTQMKQEDQDWVLTKLIQISAYMGELSITKNKDITQLVRYWNKSTRKLPYNSHLGKANSPASFVSGMINNMMFGRQHDITRLQLTHLESLIEQFQQIIEAIQADYSIRLQKFADENQVEFRENLWIKE